jgi:hypothetical protein
VSARRPGGAAAETPAKRRPWAPINPCASQPRPTRHHPFPSGLMQAGDHGAHRPRGTSTRCAQSGDGPPHRTTPGSSAARTARRQRRGHRRSACPDTWMHRTPGHRTPGRWTSARPVGRTSSRRDWGRGQGNDRPGRRPDISSRPATTRWAARPGPGHSAWGALGHPGRLRGDGTCTAALTAAATGQLPSTARHEAAPRRTALVCWSWRVRGEGNGTTER